jgi:hypothetical protein
MMAMAVVVVEEMIMTMNLAQGVSQKKFNSIPYFINHSVLNLRFNDGAFVCFFFVLSNCVLVGGHS